MLATKKKNRALTNAVLQNYSLLEESATEETGEQGFHINTEGFAQSLRNLSDILDNVARQFAGVITEHHNLVNIGVRLSNSRQLLEVQLEGLTLQSTAAPYTPQPSHSFP